MAENENGFMPCDECGVNEACYTISVMMAGQVTQRHLCAECMAKMNMSIATGSVKHLLGAIMSAISGTIDGLKPADEKPVPDVSCPRCGTTLAEFTKSGRLGCSGCYEAFREQLTPMLQQIHGRVEHTGRRPLDTEAARRSRSVHEELQRQMELAAANEDFETAAMLRDQLRALPEMEGEA